MSPAPAKPAAWYRTMIAEAAKRRARVVHLHDVEGKTFEEIGEIYNVTRQRAQKIYLDGKRTLNGAG